ncbi:MAG: hypothetical protein EB068_01685 [Betaproteobacteria bacterium]|nr:hypothetical protein [Betaproteobacteria bacterium]
MAALLWRGDRDLLRSGGWPGLQSPVNILLDGPIAWGGYARVALDKPAFAVDEVFVEIPAWKLGGPSEFGEQRVRIGP